MSAPRIDPGRVRALECLARQARLFPALAPDLFDDESLSPLDGGFAHAIYSAAIRRWITLEFLFTGFLARSHPLEPNVRAALLAGAAQILFLDRVPVHAAIDTSVEWLKHAGPAKAAGLVNAVLRKVALQVATQIGAHAQPAPIRRAAWTNQRDELPLSAGGAIVLRRALLPEDSRDRLAIGVGIPPALVRRWTRAFGDERAQRLAHHTLIHPPTLLNVASMREPFPHDMEHHTRAWAHPGARLWQGTRDALSRMLSQRRDIWAQDAASQAVIVQGARSLVIREGALVIDLCAGQGTKTRQLAARFPSAAIIACDTDAHRARVLREATAHLPNVRVHEYEEVRGRCAGQAALVLLDVPCSNTGVLARRAEAAVRADEASIARLVETQRDILRLGSNLLAPGGRLLYATCSLEPEENEAQCEWFEQTGLGRVLDQHRTWPGAVPGDPADAYQDASFWALLASVSPRQ